MKNGLAVNSTGATELSPQPMLSEILNALVGKLQTIQYEFTIFDLPSLDSASTDMRSNTESLRELAVKSQDGILQSVEAEYTTFSGTLIDESGIIGIVKLLCNSAISPADATRLTETLQEAMPSLTLISSRALLKARYERVNEAYTTMTKNQHEFIRVVSHDLRSPLTSMRGFIDMLLDGMAGDLNDQQQLFVEKIAAGVEQIHALVENIQDAGRFDPETGFYEMMRAPTDIGEIATRIVHNHVVPAEKQALSMSVWIADDVPILNADANMIERGLTNLVDNAIKYTPNGGQIDVSVRRVHDAIWISVRDNGHGISEEDQKLLFRRHVRLARPDQKRIKGSGLGLFIVRSVAQRHGGEAWVESEAGKGSTFSFSIPLKGRNLLANVAQE